MTVTAYPKPATSITTDQFRDYFRTIISTGAANDAALKPSGDSSGLVVKLASGLGVVDGIVVNSDAIQSIPVAAGSGGGLSRIDTLVANLDFSTTPCIQFAVIQGTPAATNAAPPSLALSGSVVYRWPVCDIAVSPTASTINAADVTDRRTLTGAQIGLWGTRPDNPRNGQLGYNSTTRVWEWWDGTAWTNLLPATDWASISNKPTTFAPIVGTASNQAKAGDWVPAWTDVTGKPATFPPSAHTHPWSDIYSQPATYPPTIGAASNQAVAGNDARLTDARTPKPHTHPISDVTSLQAALDGKQPAGRYVDNAYSGVMKLGWDGSKVVTTVDLTQIPMVAVGDGIDTGNNNVYSMGARNTPVTSNYVGAWINGDGRIGASASTRRVKQDIADWSPDLNAVLAIRLVQFRYIEQVKKHGSDAPVDFGVIAEELVELGLGAWVFYDKDGQVQGVHYERLCLAMLPVLQDHEKRLAALEGR